MTRFYDDVDDWMSSSLIEFGRGAHGPVRDEATYNLARVYGRWVSADETYMRRQRAAADYSDGRIALGTALRQLALNIGNTGWTVASVWLSNPGIASAIEVTVSGRYEPARTIWVGPSSALSESELQTVNWTFSLPPASTRVTSVTRLAELQGLLDGVTEPEGIVFEPTTGTHGDVLGTLRLSDERMATLSARAQAFAHLTVLAPTGRASVRVFWSAADDDSALTLHVMNSANHTNRCYPGMTADTLEERARTAYRAWLRMNRGVNSDPDAAARAEAQRQHRAASAQRFEAFRQARPAEPTQVISTLPFVPHGLASSRRWGIEIESGGARGIEAPPRGWDRKTDGSLRSAWDGYTEVQDFEAFEEERTERIRWSDCINRDFHMPHEEYYDPETREYAYRIRDGYIPVDACEHCGNITHMVLVEPQTITHSRQHDDCAEFVSPILVSMHSNGLETLLQQISLQPQNDSAGVHVHVESNDLTDKQIAALVYGYDLLEPIIESSYRRNVRRFCNRRDTQNVLGMARAAKGKGADVTIRGGERYVTVNTNSLSAHGTIEFRAMGPVYEYEHLIRWAMFCREMVNLVAAGVTQKQFAQVKKWEDLTALFARYGKEYLRAVVYEMTGETGTVASLVKEGVPIPTEAWDADLAGWERELLATWDRTLNIENATVRLVQADLVLDTV